MVFIRHWTWDNSLFTTQISPVNIALPMTIFFSDVEPLSEHFPVTLHLSPATRILNKKPGLGRENEPK